MTKQIATQDVIVAAPKMSATDELELRIQSMGRHFMMAAPGTGGQFCICGGHAGHRMHKQPKAR